ncbi:MAG TPA: hypothetical protein PKD85_15560, partial [Saprospiraceae bacterium]|nr:hypothetical protein [Saprospiraceae bacterium]
MKLLLIDWCTLPWWVLPLFPFLLGLALGWAIWGRYKSVVAELEGDLAALKTKIKGLESDLSKCRSHSAELEGDLALAKGKLREVEHQLSGKISNDLKVLEDAAGLTSLGLSSGTSSSSEIIGSGEKYAKLKSDNLQIIEGIGPKMDEVL